jgi:DNA-binding IclR family transcriptional regulator
MRRQKSEYNILTVANALRMLEVLAAEGDLGVTELANRLGLHKNNVFRVLATLEQRGFVQQSLSSERRYRLGLRCFEIGQAFTRSHSLVERARPVLKALVRESGESAHLGTLAGFEVSHLDGQCTDRLLRARLRVGERLPCHTTALGKVLLGCAPARVREAYDREVASKRQLERRTPATIVDRDKLFEHLRTVGARGWALEAEECEPGLASAAAPIFDGEGQLAGGLSISGPVCRLDLGRLESQIVPLLLHATEQLSRELGYQT